VAVEWSRSLSPRVGISLHAGLRGRGYSLTGRNAGQRGMSWSSSASSQVIIRPRSGTRLTNNRDIALLPTAVLDALTLRQISPLQHPRCQWPKGDFPTTVTPSPSRAGFTSHFLRFVSVVRLFLVNPSSQVFGWVTTSGNPFAWF
jgi:hypothetical protein